MSQKYFYSILTVLILQFYVITTIHSGICQDYFDCNYYHYFSDTVNPLISISKEDSINLCRYRKKFYELTKPYAYYTPDYFLYFSYCWQYFPYIKGYYDTLWIERLESDTGYHYRSLTNWDILDVLEADMVILGKVIDKRQPVANSDREILYKTDYVIEVMDIIHSYFDLKLGDKVLVKDKMGLYKWDTLVMRITMSHIKEYHVGEESIFSPIKHNYDHFMAGNVRYYGRKDIYCPQAFAMPMGNEDFAESIRNKVADLKLFFSTEYKNHNLKKQ